ncbi:hypothetical protein [Oceanobacillus kapialis]|uniref:hypothetical protein n=1 Tax=Oceanobacillus kapialis TaxID=481353 RepID=UPI00384F2EC9
MLFILCIFLILSIYTDITKGSIQTGPKHPANMETVHYTVQQIKVQQGDTVISIIEGINPSLKGWNVEDLLTDFKVINPSADPFKLHVDHYYYFPVYE